MFEKEITEIKERYTNSIELLNAAKEIEKKYSYWQEKENKKLILSSNILYIKETAESLKIKALENLYNIIQYNELKNFPCFYGYSTKEKTIEEAAEIVKNITIEDFYFSMCYYIPYYNNNKDYNTDRYKFVIDNKKMLVTANNSYHDYCILCLNCIHLLNNPEPITTELKNKIYQKTKNGETFIFEGCKVTQYKNGKLNIEFSDKEVFNKFLNHFNKGLKKAEENYNIREKGAA